MAGKKGARIFDADALRAKMASLKGTRLKPTTRTSQLSTKQKVLESPCIPVNFGRREMYVPDPPRKVPVHVTQTPTAEIRPMVEAARDRVQDAMIMDFISQLPKEVTEGRVAALARQAKRRVQEHIAKAREEFNLHASQYVRIHLDSTVQAMANKDFQTASKSAQWALENIGEGKTRVIDKVKEAATGTKVMIGVQLGGIPQVGAVVEAE